MNPYSTELESPSTGTGLETPGQQCLPNGETGQTAADGYLLVGMGSNQGGDASPPTERVGTRDGTATTPENSSNTIFLQASRKPEDKDKGSEENKQFDPGGKGEKPPPWNAAVMVLFSFLGGVWAMGGPLFVLRENSSNTIFLQASRKPEDKDKGSEENKQFDPGGKGEKPPPWNAAVMVLFSFLGGVWAMGGPLFVLRVLCLCVPVYMFNVFCSIR